ncbi:MAG TPA: hypothetical protein ENJ26_02435, partial [Rhodobacteraceae bacterium]|nr:hypothetical protein [Paracoccaceae bacterium]
MRRRQLSSFSRETFSVWLHQHRLAMRTALSHIKAAPLSTALTVLAIAIALALPNALFLAIDAIGDALGSQGG